MKRKRTPSRAEANARYDAENYKLIGLRLRLEDDKDIIEDFERAKQNGIKSRDWMRELFEGLK